MPDILVGWRLEDDGATKTANRVRVQESKNQNHMFIPVIIFLASATFGAPTALSQSETYELASNPETLGAYVREYYAETPVLADIAWCESRMRHLGADGRILRGTVDSDDVGVMQINTRYHVDVAQKLDIDLYSLQGNLEYAQYLYEKQGTKRWLASSPCWGRLAVK